VIDGLCGDLEAVEQEPGAMTVDIAVDHLPENLGKDDLKGTVVLDDGDLDRVHGRDWFFGVDVKPGVVVAKMLAFEGWRLTLFAAGHHVPTFRVQHSCFPFETPTPTLPHL
jgi:hypothetical protein